MIRLIKKNVTNYIVWMIMGLFLLPAVSSAELKTINDLAVSALTFHSVTLTWTSPEIANSYDVRYLTSTLNSDSWDVANQVLGEPPPGEAGMSQSMTFSGLLPKTTYYFAIKSCYEDGNCSALSNIANTTTDNDDFIRYIMHEDGEDGTIKRWNICQDAWPPLATMANIIDIDEERQNHVIEFQRNGTKSKFCQDLEDGNKWNYNTAQFENVVVKCSIRAFEEFTVYINVETNCDVENMLYLLRDSFVKYLQENWDNQWDLDLLDRVINEKPAHCLRGLYIYYFLDPEVINEEWHILVRDLQADLQYEKPFGKILKVNEFGVFGSMRIDDIMFGKAVNTGDDTTPPVPPTNLTAEAISSSDINLSWDASTDNVGIAEYRIYRDGLEIGMSTITSYADKGLLPLITYTYKVAAYDNAGNLSDYSELVSEETLETVTEEPEEEPKERQEEPEEGQEQPEEGQEEGQAQKENEQEQEEVQEEEQGSKEIACFIMTSVFGE